MYIKPLIAIILLNAAAFNRIIAHGYQPYLHGCCSNVIHFYLHTHSTHVYTSYVGSYVNKKPSYYKDVDL